MCRNKLSNFDLPWPFASRLVTKICDSALAIIRIIESIRIIYQFNFVLSAKELVYSVLRVCLPHLLLVEQLTAHGEDDGRHAAQAR